MHGQPGMAATKSARGVPPPVAAAHIDSARATLSTSVIERYRAVSKLFLGKVGVLDPCRRVIGSPIWNENI